MFLIARFGTLPGSSPEHLQNEVRLEPVPQTLYLKVQSSMSG